MNWFKHIRQSLGERELRKYMQQTRQTAVTNFADARSVAILYQEKGEGFFILVKQYVKYLRTEHGIRNIMALCFIDEKKLVPHYQVHRLKYDYFTKSELDWRLEPKCDQVTNFVKEEFDILIDFEKQPSLPLRFVLARSRAKMKVGRYQAEMEPYYDLMLMVKDTATFDEYVAQVNHYLTVINTTHARA